MSGQLVAETKSTWNCCSPGSKIAIGILISDVLVTLWLVMCGISIYISEILQRCQLDLEQSEFCPTSWLWWLLIRNICYSNRSNEGKALESVIVISCELAIAKWKHADNIWLNQSRTEREDHHSGPMPRLPMLPRLPLPFCCLAA